VHIYERYPSSTFLANLAKHDAQFGLLTRVNEWFQAMDGREDPHFGAELDVDYYSRLWELMLADILHGNGLGFQTHEDGPDFSIQLGEKTMWIEGICPGLGEPGRPDSLEPPVRNPKEAIQVPVEKVTLRVASGLKTKADKFRHYIDCGRIRATDVCIVALSTAKIDAVYSVFSGLPVGVRSTLGLGDPFAVFDSKTMEKIREGIGGKFEIAKKGGAEVRMDPFLTGELKHVAAFLCSDNSPFRMPYDRYASTALIHNPTATTPLEACIFKNIVQIWPIMCSDESCFRIFEVWYDGRTVRRAKGWPPGAAHR
jgi:hypothetical protein